MNLFAIGSAIFASGLLAAADPAGLAVFQERLNAYVQLRGTAARDVPDPNKKATPAEIQERELTLASAIRKLRPEAKQGDVFTADVQPVFVKMLRKSLSARAGGADRKASIKEGNPKHEKAPGEVIPVIEVNKSYPTNAPLSTVPPSLLDQLPKLPKNMEYRFVGRILVLRDSESNLIVDFIKDAIPVI